MPKITAHEAGTATLKASLWRDTLNSPAWLRLSQLSGAEALEEICAQGSYKLKSEPKAMYNKEK